MSSIDELLYASHKAGVLPLTSECNMRCVFCSNRFNPPGVEAVFMGPRAVEEVKAGLGQLAGAEKVVIGESATRICEGEPLTHPHFTEILHLVRERYPDKPLRLTTNGSLLTREIAGELAAMDVEVTVSLNSSSPRTRSRIMGDPEPDRALEGIRHLEGAGARFHGSVVALSSVTGTEDIAATLRFLESHGALTCRVFIPGYTRRGLVDRLYADRNAVGRTVRDLAAQSLQMPVTVEPPALHDLIPEVEGVMRGSAAAKAGILRGDVIRRVDGVDVRCRVHAFGLLRDAENPVVEVEQPPARHRSRSGEQVTVRLIKPKGEAPGVVMSHDVDLARVEDAIGIAADRAEAPVFITSSLARDVVGAAMAAAGRRGRKWAQERLFVAPNRFFGGNIGSAGLLTTCDIVEALEQCNRQGISFDLVVLPAAPFDDRGRDLVGRPYTGIQVAYGVPVVLV